MGRESRMFFGSDGELVSLKWEIYKVILRYSEAVDNPPVKPQFPIFYALSRDPREDWNQHEVGLSDDASSLPRDYEV